MIYPKPGEYWMHYKGGTYLVLLVMMDTETEQTRIGYTDGVKYFDRVASGLSPVTGEFCGWCDPLPDGRVRFEKVA